MIRLFWQKPLEEFIATDGFFWIVTRHSGGLEEFIATDGFFWIVTRHTGGLEVLVRQPKNHVKLPATLAACKFIAAGYCGRDITRHRCGLEGTSAHLAQSDQKDVPSSRPATTVLDVVPVPKNHHGDWWQGVPPATGAAIMISVFPSRTGAEYGSSDRVENHQLFLSHSRVDKRRSSVSPLTGIS
jgi:hypothetical protein